MLDGAGFGGTTMPTFRRILLSRPRFMGDVLLTTPLVRQMRRLFPAAHLAYLTEERFAPLLAHNPWLDEVIALQTRTGGRFYEQASATARLVRHLRRQNFDLAVDLFGNPRTALLCRATGAPTRVGGDFRGRRYLYTVRVQQDHQLRNAIDFHWHSLLALGLEKGDNRTEVFLTAPERDWAKQYLSSKGLQLDIPIVGLHPGATWPNKRWPAEKFADAAQRVVRAGAQVLITQGPDEHESAQVVMRGAAGTALLDVLNLRQLAAVLAELEVYVANDSGAMHLSVAVGTKTLGLFGPSQPEIWFPYSAADGHRALAVPIECRPCHKDYCPLGTLACLQNLTPAQVASEIVRCLRGLEVQA